MNRWQTIQQLKYLAENQTWGEGTDNPVWAMVRIASEFKEAFLEGDMSYPMLVLVPGIWSPVSKETPRLGRFVVSAMPYNRHAGDRFMQYAVIGGQRKTDSGESEGKGLLELDAKVFDLFDGLLPKHGIVYAADIISSAGIRDILAMGSTVAKHPHKLRIMSYESPTYPPVHNPESAEAGGTVTLTWEDPPDRWDLFNLTVQRKAGSNPTGPTDGTAIGPVDKGDETVLDTPGSGAWFYGIWGGYDEDSHNDVERYSDIGRFTSAVVT